MVHQFVLFGTSLSAHPQRVKAFVVAVVLLVALMAVLATPDPALAGCVCGGSHCVGNC